MSKIYISGKITGDNKYVKKFESASYECIENGWDWDNLINPVDLPSQETWTDYMLQDIKHLFNCSHIFMLSDWKESKGARIEHSIALEIGLTIIYQQ